MAEPGAGRGPRSRQRPGKACVPGWESRRRRLEAFTAFCLFPGEIRASENSYFCQAARQLASVSSSQLCVKLASGGDPTYAFNIRFTGEEVHGTSECAPGGSGVSVQRGGCADDVNGPGVIFSLICPRSPPPSARLKRPHPY